MSASHSPSSGRVLQNQTNNNEANRNIHAGHIETLNLLCDNPNQKSAAKKPFALDEMKDKFMFDPIRDIIESMEPCEIEQMAQRAFRHGRIKKTTESGSELLNMMLENCSIQPDGVIYLQILLWQVGQRDRFKKVAKVVKDVNSLSSTKIRHLDTAPKRQVDGYRYVGLHAGIEVKDNLEDELRNLLETIAVALIHSKKTNNLVLVVGVDPDNSIWVTVLMTTNLAERFRDRFYEPEIQRALQLSRVDRVVFDPDGRTMFVKDHVDAGDQGPGTMERNPCVPSVPATADMEEQMARKEKERQQGEIESATQLTRILLWVREEWRIHEDEQTQELVAITLRQMGEDFENQIKSQNKWSRRILLYLLQQALSSWP